jgi:hypothetical protein
LQPATQQRILKLFSDLRQDVAHACGRDALSYGEVMQGFLEHCVSGGKLQTFVRDSIAVEILQPHLPDVSGNLEEAFALINTEEKFAQLLLSLPEPSPEQFDELLRFARTRIPEIRRIMLPRFKALPHHPGGSPKKLASANEEQNIVEEIMKLRKPGVKLADIFARVAQRHAVSASKVKQIWLKWRKRNPFPTENRHDKIDPTA